MIRKVLITGACLMAMSGTAIAGHCPADAKAIDHALKSSKMSMADQKEVKAMRDKGMELHNSGDHRQSEKVLAEAMRKLLMAQ